MNFWHLKGRFFGGWAQVFTMIAGISLIFISNSTPARAALAAPTFVQEAETAWNSTSSPKTTASFNVQAGDVLVAYGMTEDSGSSVSLSDSTTTSGAWINQQTVTTSGYTWVGVWTKQVTVTQAMKVTFKRAGNSANYFGGDVLTFRGSSGIGVSAKTTGASGTPTLNLTTTQASSAIVVVDGDWNAADGTNRVWLTNAGPLTEQSYYRNSARYTVYAGYHANAGAAGTYVVGLSAPSQKYGIIAVEVKGQDLTPDTTPPTVAMTAPAAGATVAGSAVALSATASDNVGVAGVQFQVDGSNLGAEDTTAPYGVAWNSTAVANGAHTLSAVARDAAGNTATSSVTVTVSNAPVISGVTVTSITTTTAQINWSTNIPGDSQVNYGTAASYGSQTALDSTLVTTHAQVLSGLTDATFYHYQVLSRGADGNLATSGDFTFTTQAIPDTTPPTVAMNTPLEGTVIVGNATVSATASDNVGVAGVQFKLDGNNLGAEATASPYSINWDSTTALNGSHTLSAVARDAAGNTTLSNSIDVTVTNSPVISGITVGSITASSASISWMTNVLSDSQIAYGTTSAYGSTTTLDPTMTSSHSQSLNGLASGTVYHFQVLSRDGTGVLAASSDNTFTTANPPDTTPPVVSISAPANGATVSGSAVTVSATATDNVGVAGVQFKLDGNNLSSEDTTNPYSVTWNTTTATNGTHVLTAVVRDAAGNSTTSSAVNVTVNNVSGSIALVQKNFNGNESATSNMTVSFTSSVTAGHFLLVSASAARPASTLTISDTQGNVFTNALGPVNDPNQDVNIYIWYVQSAKGGADTITITPPAPAALEIHISEWSGMPANVTVDQTSTATGNGTAVTSGAKTTTAAGELVFGYSWVFNTASAGAGFTPLSLINGDLDEYQVQAAAGSVAATFTQSASGTWFGLMATFKAADIRTTQGEWSNVITWPTVAVHAHLLDTGKLLTWETGSTATVWDPATGLFTNTPNNWTNLLCSGHAFLSDGTFMSVGGWLSSGGLGAKDISFFNPKTQTWTQGPPLTYGRWYPNVIRLPSGKIMVISGDNLSSSDLVPNPEVYDPTTNSWTILPAHNIQYYPFTFDLPNGKVAVVGASEQMNDTETFDPVTGQWTVVDSHLFDGGSAVMYAPGKILKAGSAADSGFTGPSSATAYTIDFNQPTPVWTQVASMASPRSFLNLTLLPDGSAIATGGDTQKDGYTLSTAVKTAEIWSPATGTWTTMASMVTPRLYHSEAMLLPDGRVFVGGSGGDSGVADQLSAEIFSPPYLFKGARPTITSSPAVVSYGQTFFVATPDAASISAVRLIAPGSTTHSFNMNQHMAELSFQVVTGGINVTAPADANSAAPGDYMLFLVNSNGVPAVAPFVNVGQNDTIAPSAPTNLLATGSIGTASLSWTAATDNIGVTGYNVYRSTISGFTPSGANKIGSSATTNYTDTTTAGIYYYQVTAQDAAGNVGPASNEATTTVLADTTPPTVSLSAPTDGSTVSGNVAVSAVASDNVGVVGVQFKLDGANLGAEDVSAPYFFSWDTTSVGNGSHSLSAVVRDAAGNTTTAAAVNVTVANPPVISAVAAGSITQTAATVSWATNISADSQVNYGPTASYGFSTTLDTILVTAHSQVLSGLSANTLYHFQVLSRAATGILAVSADNTFLTTSIGTGPVTVGSQIAGSFADATGHSAQSHLVYAANSGVWWLFTLNSNADAAGGSNHVIKSYYSSGPDLTTATWTQATDSPGATPQNSSNGYLASGRALSVAYLNNAPTDVIHAEVAMAFDGQDGTVAHIRAVVTGNTITWEGWNYHDEPTATWTIPRSGAIGVSTGKFIHTANPILQQEVDANVRKSNNADTGSTWTSGFGAVSVTDNSMQHENNAFAFAPLANNQMLAVYDNGGGVSTCYPSCGTGPAEPALTNLGYRRSNTDGTWPAVAVGTQAGGDGFVFSTDATINQNDWTMVPVSTNTIYTFRRNAAATGIDGTVYNVVSNSWTMLASQPPAQTSKAGSGVFAATDGTNVYVFVIGTDAANSIMYTKYNGSSWTNWTAVPNTNTGTQTRNYIAGYQQASNNEIGLIWMDGTSTLNEVTTSLAVTVSAGDTTPPTVSLTAPAAGATVSGTTTTISATASDNVGVAGVQFQLDGANLGAEDTSSPYSITWDTTTATNASHTLTAVARDAAGNTSSASVTVTVNNPTADTTPPTAPANLTASGTLGSATLSWNASTDNVGVSSYSVYRSLTSGFAASASTKIAQTAGLTYVDSTTPGTYYYLVTAQDAAGNISPASNQASATVTSDTTAPTVSVTTPANGATVSGNIPVTATASDNVGVVGVQFKLDGVNLGSEATTSPYSINWGTATTTNGAHSLTAVARDAAGNTTTSTAVSVTVNNVAVAIALVQKASNITSGAASLAKAFTAAVTAGNTIIVGVSGWPNPTAMTMSDSLGNVYTRVGLQLTSGNSMVALYYAKNIKGGADTVTLGGAASGTQLSMVISEFSGLNTTTPVDATVGAVGSSNAPTSGNMTPTVAGDLVIGVGTHDATTVTTAGSGFTMLLIATEDGSTHQSLAVEYKLGASSLAQPANFTLGTSAPWAQIGAMFKP